MKKILIIAYFFPPCNLTASQRALGWARYLKEFGYFPIIVTRNWEHHIAGPEDMGKKAGSSVIHEIKDAYEIYYLPYKPNLRDRIYERWSNRLVILRKALSLWEVALQYFFLFIIPFNNIYYFCKKILQEKETSLILVTANPFICFRFAYLLHKQTKTPWVADYRDDWNTDEIKKHTSFFSKTFKKITSYFEKRWVGTASHITTVSEPYAKKITAFTKVLSTVIPNGFFEEDYNKNIPESFPDFTIVYSGTLYDTQPIEHFLKGYKIFIDKQNNAPQIKLLFIGTGFDTVQEDRIGRALKGYEKFFDITERVSHAKAIELQQRAHVLLMIPHEKVKGIPTSKIYEYIALKKPVLAYKTYKGEVELTLREAGTGFYPKSEKELIMCLENFYEQYLHKEPVQVSVSEDVINKFSRKEGTKKLAELFDKLLATEIT